MKKLLLTASLMMLTASIACAGEPPMGPPPGDCPPPPPGMHKTAPPKMDLDKKLKLTDAQKVKARELRIAAHKQIKPLFEKLKSKQEQKRALITSTINKKEQIEMIDKLNEEISSLKRQIHEIQVKNMKDFESILTAKQKKTLDKIKMESRRNFQKNHKPGCRPCPPPPPMD